MIGHNEDCGWPGGPPCRRFSTDGTQLGSVIAHTFDTTSEEEIENQFTSGAAHLAKHSDVAAEQADWESDE